MELEVFFLSDQNTNSSTKFHGFRPTQQDDFFQLLFDHFESECHF